MIVIGIDPGVEGGIARICPTLGAVVWPMPTLTKANKRKAVDGRGVALLLQQEVADAAVLHARLFVVIERQQPLPPVLGGGKGAGGSVANFGRGRAALFEGMLDWAGIEYRLVNPREWQDEMLPLRGGSTKDRSIIQAKKLFPGVSLYPTARSRKESDGLSDALLLAEFGRRRLANVETAPGLFKNYSGVTR